MPRPKQANPKQIVSKAKQPQPKTAGRKPRKPATKNPKYTKTTDPTFVDEADLTGTSPPDTVMKLCGAKLVSFNSITRKNNPPGATCKKPAGWGTDHPGWGHCRHHYGNTPTHSKQAAKKQVAERMKTYGGPVNIGPHEALIQEVMRTAGHVRWLGDMISNKEESQLVQFSLKEGMDVSAWIKMYQEERKMLVNVCRVAISAGVAERRVRIAEEQGKQLAGALLTFINHPLLNLSPQQLADARPIIGEILRSLDTMQQATLPPGTIDIPLEETEEITA